MQTRQIQSTMTDDGRLRLSVGTIETRAPKDHEVLIRVEAAPINPSDLGPMIGPADMATAREVDGGVEADIPEKLRRTVKGRLGVAVPLGNEGAGVVIEAGGSDAAQALLGKTVAIFGGAMYSEHRLAPAETCLVLPDGVTPAEGASCFVNPLTALAMIETMKLEGHTALVHTAAASNLGQMLVKLCTKDGVPLVNIVRRPEHVELLRSLGAEHVCNSSDDDFMTDLISALSETDATLGFDATGGGTLASRILTAMETAQASKEGAIGGYGSSRHKQVYLYGGLDQSPTELRRSFGMAWGIGGWLLMPLLARIGADAAEALRQRVASEITTTFASSYTATVTLDEAVTLEALRGYGKQATGEKYLVTPQG